jgi:cbb3-type cytochrome oxidase subunit 1
MIPSSDKKNIAIRFFQVGLAYFLVTLLLGVIMIMGRGYAIFGPQGAKIAHVHAGVLGFVTLIIMGAMYQILPTLTGSKLYGEELAYRQFLLISLGIFGLFLSQLLLSGKTRNLLIIIFGGFVLGASLLFAYLIFKTASTSKSKIKPITIPFFKAATLYYLAGITMGILMVSFPNYFSGFLLGKTAHAHLGTLGFITMTVMGAEYQMFPMLSLKKLKSEKWAWINFWSFTIAVAGFFISLMLIRGDSSLIEQRLASILLTFFVVLLIFSIYVFLGNMLMTLKGASWSSLDISVKFLGAGHLFLFIATLIGGSMGIFYHLGLIDWLKGIGIAGAGFGIYILIWTHAHLSLIGFVTLTIMGAMYHLIPMIVWMEKYGPKMGKEEVPKIQDLFSQTVANAVLWSMVLGLLGILIGSMYEITLLLRGSAFLIAGSGIVFSFAMYKITF